MRHPLEFAAAVLLVLTGAASAGLHPSVELLELRLFPHEFDSAMLEDSTFEITDTALCSAAVPSAAYRPPRHVGQAQSRLFSRYAANMPETSTPWIFIPSISPPSISTFTR